MTKNITAQDAKYMYQFIEKIIEEVGPRMPCSPQEQEAAKIIENEFGQICDHAQREGFTCRPRVFLGWIKINIALVAISAFCFFSIARYPDSAMMLVILTLLFNVISFIILWNEFFNYKEFIDPLFKKEQSQNVIGIFKVRKERKKIIIFSGHHDSALQFNLLRYLGYGYALILGLAMALMFFWLGMSLIYLIAFCIGKADYSTSAEIACWAFTIGGPALFALLFFVSPGEKANKVPGAVDNLSAVAVVLGIGRYLAKNRELVDDHTEIRLISFGCEEAGLRGAYRYVAAHSEELAQCDAEVVNMDGIQMIKRVLLIEYEPTTRTQHSKEVIDKLQQAADNAGVTAKSFGAGIIEKIIGQVSGGTDATAFSKAGIKAATLMSMDLAKYVKYYHQPTDTPDMIEPGALENALKICLEYISVSKE